MSEVNDAHGVLHFLDRDIVDQHHFGPGPDVYLLEGGKGAGDVLDPAVELDPANRWLQGVLHSVRPRQLARAAAE